jgi:hypothetical protein
VGVDENFELQSIGKGIYIYIFETSPLPISNSHNLFLSSLQCGKIQDLYEESFGMLVFRKHKLADIQKDICENGVRACVPGFYPKHEEHLDPARDAKKDDL